MLCLCQSAMIPGDAYMFLAWQRKLPRVKSWVYWYCLPTFPQAKRSKSSSWYCTYVNSFSRLLVTILKILFWADGTVWGHIININCCKSSGDYFGKATGLQHTCQRFFGWLFTEERSIFSDCYSGRLGWPIMPLLPPIESSRRLTAASIISRDSTHLLRVLPVLTKLSQVLL